MALARKFEESKETHEQCFRNITEISASWDEGTFGLV
jgi:hypothetical protein